MFLGGPRTVARSNRRLRPVDELFTLLRQLLSGRGEVSGARRAGAVVAAYKALDAREADRFFDHLAAGFSPNPAALQKAAEAYHQDPTQANLVRLQAAVESPRQELFRRWNMAPGGAAELVAMRKRLLPTLDALPERAGIDADLAHLFRSWFSRGFLVLERIDWRTPAVVLERLIEYEAVHAIKGWRDLRRTGSAGRAAKAQLRGGSAPSAPATEGTAAAPGGRGGVGRTRSVSSVAAARPR